MTDPKKIVELTPDDYEFVDEEPVSTMLGGLNNPRGLNLTDVMKKPGYVFICHQYHN